MSRSRSRLADRRPPWTPWVVAALALISFPAFADDAASRSDERVYVLDGATISWDLGSGRLHPPTAEQAARLAEAMQLWRESKAAEEPGRWSVDEIEVETLPNGVRRARLPLAMMNFAVLNFAAGRGTGEAAGLCAEGPSSARESLRLPAASAPEEK